MSDRIGLAVVGLGMAAKPHALALQNLADMIDDRGCYARSAEARAAFCQTYGFPQAADVEALAHDPTVDALLLITPPNARLESISLFAGQQKHILTKKPLERTSGAAIEIVDLCAASDVSLGVVFQHRIRAASEALTKLLREGALGPIRMVRADLPRWRDQSYYYEPGRGSYACDGGGVLISQAIHTLDLMLSMTGPATAVQAICSTIPFHVMAAEDFAAGAIEFESDALGSIFTSSASFPGDAESLAFYCANGSALLKSGVLTVHWRDGRAETSGSEATTGGGADPMAFPYDWHKSLIADFVTAIKTGRSPRVTGSEALKVHHLISAIEASSRSGQKTQVSKG